MQTRLFNFKLLAITGVALGWLCAGNAQAQFFQSEAPDRMGKYSFLSPGKGAFGAIGFGYARAENPPFEYGANFGPDGGPAVFAKHGFDTEAISGHVGYSLGRDSQMYIPMLGSDYRVVAGGQYYDGETRQTSESLGGTQILAITDTLNGTFVPEDTRNFVFSDFSHTEINVSFQGDHYRDSGLIITKGLGYTFMRRETDTSWDNITIGTGESNTHLFESVNTAMNAVDVYLGARYRISPNLTFHVASKLAFYRAQLKLRAYQEFEEAAVGPFGSRNDVLEETSEFGVRSHVETGLAYENEYFHMGVFAFYDHFSYIPIVVNPNEIGGPSVFLDAGSANTYGIRLSAGARF